MKILDAFALKCWRAGVERTLPKAAFAIAMSVPFVASCGPQPDDIANRVEKECLAKKGGSDWLRMNKHTSSLEEFCRGKGLYEREEYLRRHDPDELRREHAAAQAQLNEILSSSPPK